MMSTASCASAGVSSLMDEDFMVTSCLPNLDTGHVHFLAAERIYTAPDILGYSVQVGGAVHTNGRLGGGMLQLQSAFGVFALLAIAFAISERRAAVSWRHAAIGLAVTFVTAVVLLKVP